MTNHAEDRTLPLPRRVGGRFKWTLWSWKEGRPADGENLKPRSSLQRILTHDDVVLESCMDKLSAPVQPDGDAEDLRKDEVARRLVLRLFELSGAGTPDWNDDTSMFDRRTLLGLTAYVDEHLRIAPSLTDMSIRVGMSPSHFAKKFRRSTGLSMGRFRPAPERPQDRPA